jgi:DNA-binding NarL/FixJ family response regulator
LAANPESTAAWSEGKFQLNGGRAMGTTGTLRVLVADDHEVVRKGLRTILEEQPGWQVSGEASDGREAVDKVKMLKPDVTVVDVGMPGLNGLEATRQMLKNDPETKVLILTMHESDPLIREVLDAGARGYLLKSDAGKDLVSAVDKKPRTPADNDVPASRLTPRQREIVQLLAEGKSSKEVAVALNLSVKTAETHRANIMRRLNCHSVSELVRYAIRNNIIDA